MQQTDEARLVFDTLFKKYQSVVLSKKQLGETLGLSTATIDRMRKEGVGPQWRRHKNRSIQYPLTEVANYVVTNQVKTMSTDYDK